ncbi:MAG: hypothetical protein CVV06_04895 [Gammaproteobacteria bacterium HGW-Gammaproteobacteria-10]|nr:MAG: hypothetical protein CVV06_04895 [Gammaproteobacteria bacterium HGW-Gammaproteobacteria-10]
MKKGDAAYRMLSQRFQFGKQHVARMQLSGIPWQDGVCNPVLNVSIVAEANQNVRGGLNNPPRVKNLFPDLASIR